MTLHCEQGLRLTALVNPGAALWDKIQLDHVDHVCVIAIAVVEYKRKRRKKEEEEKKNQSSRHRKSCMTCPLRLWPAVAHPCWEQSTGRNLSAQRIFASYFPQEEKKNP